MFKIEVKPGFTGLDLKKGYHVTVLSSTQEGLNSLLDNLLDVKKTYGSCSIADLCDLAFVGTDIVTYMNFGWTSLNISDVKFSQLFYDHEPYKYTAQFPIAVDLKGLETLEPTKPEPKKDMVNHPPHYMSETGLETIDVIEAFTFDLKGIEAVATGNVLKYMCRWKKKDGLRDLKKAQRYLTILIDHVEKLEKENE